MPLTVIFRIDALLTAPKVYDLRVAVPLMNTTSQRLTYLYDLMDAAYDAQAIGDHSASLNHKPIIRPRPAPSE